MNLQHYAALVSTFALTAFTDPATAQTYPNKPVHLVIPYATGGSSDVMGRAVAQKLGEMWGKSLVVENKPGATTTIGIAYVAKAPPDGYTFLLAAPPLVITQYVYPNLSYTPRDLASVSLVAYYPLILTVPKTLPVNSMKDLVEFARSKPGATYASPGAGTTPHLIGEMLAQDEKLDMTHVPYKSGGQAVIDLIGERLTFYAGVPTEVVPHIRSGALKPIAVLAPVRSPLFPDVPTSTEAGYPRLQARSWSAVLAPAGTPPAIIKAVSENIAEIVRMPEFSGPLKDQGAVLVGSTPAELDAFLDEERGRYGPLVKAIGLKVN